MKKSFLIAIVFLTLLMFCPSLSFADTAGDKLHRGLINTVTGWMEVFTTPADFSEEHGYAAGLLFGVPGGIFKAIWRTGVGIYETVTFPLPLPSNYQSITDPEFVIESSYFE